MPCMPELIDMLVRKNEKFACFLHIGTQKYWHENHAGTQGT